MEIKRQTNISQKLKEVLLNSLNTKFSEKPSSYGYKHDIEILLKELSISDEQFFTIVIESLSKDKRNNEDLIFITSYLFFMQEFIKLLKAKESYKKEKKLLDYILNLSSHLDYMHIPKNMILMKFGDKGDKAYINLSGEVDIMVPNSKIMSVYENDYLLYLASLIKYREYSLINSIINENFPNYPIIIYDDFTPTEEILSIFENTNKKEKKLSTFIKGNNNEIIKKLLDINNIIHHLKIENSRGKSQKSINISKNFDKDGEQSEEQNQKNTMEKALKLNASNEELMSSLELYIISIRQLLDLFDFSYLNDNDELITNCSSEEYINRIRVPSYKESSNMITNFSNTDISFFELKIYFYTKITSLQKGNYFGELALQDPNAGRAATIITSQDCHFALLTKKIYNKSLKVNTNLRLKGKLIFFIKLPIFADIPLLLFYKKYYTHLSKHYFLKNRFVIIQGEKPKQLYMLNKGSYELTCNVNISELTELIFYLIEKAKKYQTISQINDLSYYQRILIQLKENVEKEKNILAKSSDFKSVFFKDSLIKISEIGCPDITGFEELIGKEGLYAFSLQAKDLENIIYSLDINFYKELYQKNPSVQKRHDHIIKIKLDLIIKRLLKIRDNIISTFLKTNTTDDLTSFVSREIENFKNEKKEDKRFINLKNTQFNFNRKNNDSFDIRDFNNNEKNLFLNRNKLKKHSKYLRKFDKKKTSKKNNMMDLINTTQKTENTRKKNYKFEYLTKTSNRFLFEDNTKYMHLVPIIKLRKNYKTPNITIREKHENILTENNKSIKGKKVNECIKCYFDKKIRISNSINLTAKLRKKIKQLKLESKMKSILAMKQENKKKHSLSIGNNKKNNKRKENDNKTDIYNSYERMVAAKNINLNMLLLTNKTINLTNKNSHFQKSIEKLINSSKKEESKENKKEKIYEILKEDNDENDYCQHKRISVYKRDEYYKKNLIRIKLFYGIDKK